MRTTLIAIGVGLVAGALSALGQAHLDGTLDAFANSLSTWLVAPFVVGGLAASRGEAALAGCLTSASQLAGYYVLAHETTAALVAFWVGCALIGGPIFGL